MIKGPGWTVEANNEDNVKRMIVAYRKSSTHNVYRMVFGVYWQGSGWLLSNNPYTGGVKHDDITQSDVRDFIATNLENMFLRIRASEGV